MRDVSAEGCTRWAVVVAITAIKTVKGQKWSTCGCESQSGTLSGLQKIKQ